MELGIEVSDHGTETVLALSGDIDIHSAPRVREELASLQSQGRTGIVVDLAEVNFLDSSALGALVAAHRDLSAAGGFLRLAAARPHVLKVFRITRLSDVIPLFETVEAARA